MPSNFDRLINKLEGSPDPKGRIRPVPRILLFQKELDAFDVVTPETKRAFGFTIKPDAKTLLLIHGTFSITTPWVLIRDVKKPNDPPRYPVPENQHKGSFGELLERADGDTSFLKKWMEGNTKYEQVIAYDHYTVLQDIRENTDTLMTLLKELEGESFCFSQTVDIITGSRGGLLGQYIANTYGTSQNTCIPIGQAVIKASPNRGSSLLNFEHLAPKYEPNRRKRYKKALKWLIDQLTIPKVVKTIVKAGISFNGKFIEDLVNQPGLKVQKPGSETIREIQEGSPGHPDTLYLPIVGTYDGSKLHFCYMKDELASMIHMFEQQYDNFGIGVLKIFRIKPGFFLPWKRLEDSLYAIFTHDIETVIKPHLFHGEENDLVVPANAGYDLPALHLAEGFEPEDFHCHMSIAIHGYYLDEVFKPFEFDETGKCFGPLQDVPPPPKVKDIVRDWLEDPSTGVQWGRKAKCQPLAAQNPPIM